VTCAAPTEFLRPLADASEETAAGGKAVNLARLMALGASVPDGVVLTCGAFDAFLAESGVGERLDRLVGDLKSTSTLEALQDVDDRARALIMAATLTPGLAASCEAIARQWLPHHVLAVRSSAVGEDGDRSSFAGQFDSVLGVTSLAGLRGAVLTCYASYWSARAMFYRRTREATALSTGTPWRHSLAGMALVIQRQIAPAAAGVLFTRNPDPRADRRDTMVVEYCAGLADRLVAGCVDPGRVVVSRATGAVVQESALEDPDNVSAQALVASRLGELARLGLLVEQGFGSPQDIEWAIDRGGRIWLVQSRPITTPVLSATNPVDRVLWTNANVSENFPEPISPLLYSIASPGYYHYFRNLGIAFGISTRRLDAMERPLRSIIGVHGARMYYNLTSIHAVLRLAPFGERLAHAFNTFVGADEIAPPTAGAVSWRDRAGLAQSVELARIAAFTTWQYLWLGRRIRAFERTADALATRTRPQALQSASLDTLGALLAEFIDIRCRRWKNASLADAAAMVTYALLERMLARSGYGGATHTRLLRALPGVPSSIPPRRLWALSRMIRDHAALRSLFDEAEAPAILAQLHNDPQFADFRRAFDEFLDTWGFRSSAELMLTVPALDERPEPAIELLKQYARDTGESPELVVARQADERRHETSSLLRTIARRSPLRALAVWLLVRWTQRSIAYRERARLKQALLYTRCRRVALRIGDELVKKGQLASRDDAFMLTWSEIDELTSGRAMFAHGAHDLVLLRRRQHAALSELTPPDTFRLPQGDVFPPSPGFGETATAGMNRTMDRDVIGRPDGRTVLTGTTACGGRVSAPAAVLADVNQASRLTRGDVLVTRQTDPGWGPVFCLISGLVIERGGMLSHGAIIAREFGLPCVVGVKQATTRIAHGVKVTVDGDRGECVLEARP
jgi:pyruvate,water dikinase